MSRQTSNGSPPSLSSRPPVSRYISSASTIPVAIPKARQSSPEYYELLKDPISPQNKIKKTVSTAISATGDKVAIVGASEYSVFNTDPGSGFVSLCCTGYFDRSGKTFYYSLCGKNNEMELQLLQGFKVSTFTRAALCDAYLAIGAPGKLMFFTLDGLHAGRMVTYQTFPDPTALIERLAFSSDGTELLALVKSETAKSTKLEAIAIPTSKFPQPPPEVNLKRQKPINITDLKLHSSLLFGKDWDMSTPKGIAFSRDGTMVAIYTNWSNGSGTAGIQLLKREESNWKLWGPLHKIPVFQEDDRHGWQGDGLTGISLYVSVTT